MTPFSSDGVETREHLSFNDDPSARTSANDCTEYHVRVRSGTVHSFRKSKTIRIIADAHLTSQLSAQITFQEAADKPSGIRVLDATGSRRNRAWRTDSDASLCTQLALQLSNQV
jgi:hypothetical protein